MGRQIQERLKYSFVLGPKAGPEYNNLHARVDCSAPPFSGKMPAVRTAELEAINLDRNAYRVLITGFGVSTLHLKSLSIFTSNTCYPLDSLLRITMRIHLGSQFGLYTTRFLHLNHPQLWILQVAMCI